MRASATAVLFTAALAACVGINAQRPEPQPRPSARAAKDEQDPPVVRQQAAIDQRRTAALPARRAPSGLGAAAFAHAKALVSFGPRYSGQPGWSKQLDYISAELRRHGLEPRRDTWTDRKELLTFSN
ncbi:MAG: hypothetical protein VYD05_07115, partial [Planctomycetota bacterium]|nr:hypothetical protein [Planctomycetota bacterium]